MRIQHNISALNTHRNLSFNNTQASKNLEKLSSGYKINRAGDDAAGLAISEKMRGQIRGLDMATKNSQDSISLIQTAEGALNETHSILQRMRELAVQSSNDTNVTEDRDALQKEISQLTAEIDRIANTTEFNTQKLLDGSFKGTFQIGANEGQTMDLNVGKMGAAALGLTATTTVQSGVEVEHATGTAKALADGVYTTNKEGDKLLDADGNQVGTIAGNVATLSDGSTYTFDKADTTPYTAADPDPAGDGSLPATPEVLGSLSNATIKITDGKATLDKEISGDVSKLSAGSYTISGNDVLKDNVKVGTVGDGTNGTTDGEVTIKLGDEEVKFDAADLGLTGTFGSGATDVAAFEINGVDISTREKATGTISKIDDAIKSVSDQRSALGAVQNRLEHTINNLGAASENLTAAESRIRDTDMAAEMMQFTKNNILMQAAQSMLAQANQQPQGVLQLLG